MRLSYKTGMLAKCSQNDGNGSKCTCFSAAAAAAAAKSLQSCPTLCDPEEPRSALESRRVSLGAHWVDSRESSLLRRLERGREIGR